MRQGPVTSWLLGRMEAFLVSKFHDFMCTLLFVSSTEPNTRPLRLEGTQSMIVGLFELFLAKRRSLLFVYTWNIKTKQSHIIFNIFVYFHSNITLDKWFIYSTFSLKINL